MRSETNSLRVVRLEAQRIHQAIEPILVVEPRTNLYLQRVGQRISTVANSSLWSNSPITHWTIQVHLLDNALPTAFTAGGEHVYLSNGLLQLIQSEDELATVLSHEFAHVYLEQITRNDDVMAEKIDPPVLENLLVYRFVVQGYSDGQEAKDDEAGIQLANQAGWNANNLASLIERSNGPRDRVMLARSASNRYPAGSDENRPRPIADPATFDGLKASAQSAATRIDHGKPSYAKAERLAIAFPGCVGSGNAAQVQAQSELKGELESATLPLSNRSDFHGPDAMRKSAWWLKYLHPSNRK